ncbi:MAG: hypothetical protein R3Y61_06910 [Rikenellaceae bacterium]
MLKYFRDRPSALLIVLLFCWLCVSLYVAASMEIGGWEAYLCSLSDSLQWGYLDASTLEVFMCRLGRMFLGDSELGVRFFFVLLQPVALYVFWNVVRSSKSDYRSALRYFLLCCSIPVLHISGFYASSYSLLLLSCAVALWSYKRFVLSKPGNNDGYVSSVPLLGVAFALLVYSNPVGLLLVLAMAVARPENLVSWRFYGSLAIGLILCVPYFISVEHEGGFLALIPLADCFNSFWKLLLGFFVLCNPFVSFSLFSILLSKSPFVVRSEMEKLYRVLGLMLLLLFVFVLFGGSVSYAVIIFAVFPLLFFMLRRGERSRSASRYQVVTFLVIIALLFAASFGLVHSRRPLVSGYNFVSKEVALGRIASDLEYKRETSEAENKGRRGSRGNVVESGAELLVMGEDRYFSSLMNFYTSMRVYSQRSIYDDELSFSYPDIAEGYYGKRVACEVSERALLAADSLAVEYPSFRVEGIGTYYYIIEEFYVPVSRVDVSLQSFPEKIIARQKMALTLYITNPYPYDIELGGQSGFEIILHLSSVESGREGECYDIVLPFQSQILGSEGVVTIATSVVMPDAETGNFKAGITLQRYPSISSYNSTVYDLMIVNPGRRF